MMLKELLDEGEAKLPDWDRSLVNVPATILKIFGREPPHPSLPRELLPDLGGVRKVILLIIDALGWEQLRPLLEDGNLIFSRLADEGRLCRLTSVLPSTTAAALATLATGLAPAEHGLLGYRLYLKEFGLIANMIRLSPEGIKRFDLLLELGLKPRRFFPARTIYELLAPDVKSYTILKLAFWGSGLSHFLYRGSEAVPHIGSSDMFVRMRELLEGSQDGPLFVGAYWDAVDGISHLYGPTKEELAAEVRQLSFSLEEFLNRLSSRAARDALLLITADHGQVEVRQEEIFSITRHPRLARSLLLPPTGDFRASYLHLRQGELEPIKRYLRRYRDRLIAIDSEEAIDAGLFGPSAAIKDGWRPRIGDLLLLPRERGFIFYPYDGFLLKGYHGGLSSQEMGVPLFAVRLG